MFAWILIGLISGWLAGKILNGNGYGMMADIGLGLLGGVIGGVIFEVLRVRALALRSMPVKSVLRLMLAPSPVRDTSVAARPLPKGEVTLS